MFCFRHSRYSTTEKQTFDVAIEQFESTMIPTVVCFLIFFFFFFRSRLYFDEFIRLRSNWVEQESAVEGPQIRVRRSSPMIKEGCIYNMRVHKLIVLYSICLRGPGLYRQPEPQFRYGSLTPTPTNNSVAIVFEVP
jgi:hypothetical protein